MSLLSGEIDSLRRWRVWMYLAVRDLRERYARTSIGVAWVVVSLLVWSIGIGLVYGSLFGVTPSTFLPYLATGFVCWAFLTGSLLDGSVAFTSAEGYIKQFNLPRSIYLLRVTARNTLVFLLGLSVPIGLTVFFRTPVSIETLFAIPAVLWLILVGHAHTILAAHFNLIMRDFAHALTSVLQLLFLVTPIVFRVDVLQGKDIDWIYLANPFFHLLELMRAPLLHSTLPTQENLVGAGAYLLIVSALAGLLQSRMTRHVVYLL